MGYNVAKPPFNLAEFLSQKAPRRPYKRKFPANVRLGSETSYPATVEDTPVETGELPGAPADPKA